MATRLMAPAFPDLRTAAPDTAITAITNRTITTTTAAIGIITAHPIATAITTGAIAATKIPRLETKAPAQTGAFSFAPNAQHRPAQSSCAERRVGRSGLALRELEAAASLWPSVLLAFDRARIAGEETTLLENGAQCRLVSNQCLGDAVPQCTGLTGQATAIDLADDVVLAIAAGGDQRLTQDHAQHGARKVDVLFLVVDADAARTGLEPNAS